MISLWCCCLSDFLPLLPKEKLLERIRGEQRRLGVSSTEIGHFLGYNQPTMSNMLNPDSKNPRDLSYEEAYDIVQYLLGRVSLLPRDLTVGDLMTGYGDLVWASANQKISEVCSVMLGRGFSQMPVRGEEGPRGVVTDLSIIRVLMGGARGASSVDELGGLTVGEAGVVEDVLECPLGTPLLEGANLLLSYPAVFVSRGADIVGVFTRADLLKVLAPG